MVKKAAYIFTGQVKKEVDRFREYLVEKNFDQDTIRQKTNYAGYYLTWLEAERLTPADARYNDITSFIDHCRGNGKTVYNMNRTLGAIRTYYGFLKLENPGIANPAANVTLKGARIKVPGDIVKIAELEKVYNAYPATSNRTRRNKIILGLLVYQGVTTDELHRLKPEHVKLKEGKIYIPSGKRSNSRGLELKPFQILELHEYLTGIRPKIIAGIGSKTPARKPGKINKTRIENQLFISINGSENIKNSLMHLFTDIKKINANIKNPKQIRASVIVDWLKHYNLRQVQYMAGHRYVSSTERYQANNLENLKSQVEKFHPLK